MSAVAAPDEMFDSWRPRLIRVAYRMLGSVADAEDVVQEAFLRWHGAARDGIDMPDAFVRRIVVRLCLDVLKSARHRRETYVGPWLPEPFVEPSEGEAIDVTLPLMMALERLSPLERAAFLLHDVFGLAFSEIAETIGRSEAACRQLASRARGHVREARPRFAMPREQGLALAEAFYVASRQGDMQRLRALLAQDVQAYSDGGGKVPASALCLVGIDSVLARHLFLAGAFRRHGSHLIRCLVVNGLPGFITVEHGGLLQTTALHIEQDKVRGIYVVRNPDKLRHLRRDPGVGG